MSEQSSEQPSNVERAVAFFKQPVWQRLLETLYHKYIAQGRVGGQVTLLACTADEQREIVRFLGKRVPTGAAITVRLSEFQDALNASGFNCSLPELLATRFPERPQRTRPEQREQHVQAQQRFYTALSELSETLAPDSRAAQWLQHGPHGKEALFQRYKNRATEQQKNLLHIVSTIAQGLNRLPIPPHYERLSLFAQRISGDPHFLDTNTSSGRLFLQALSDTSLHTEDTDDAANEDPDTEPQDKEVQDKETANPQASSPTAEQDQQRLYRYYEAGLLIDTISSTVAVYNLAAAYDHTDQLDPLIHHAGQRILILPLRQLLAWERISATTQDIYLFENPQVFERIVDALNAINTPKALNTLQGHPASASHPLSTLICTAGWPSVATMRLLTLLTESQPTLTLHYSGDFDIQGLRIAAYLCAHYQQCSPWHFDPASYHVALHSETAQLDPKELATLSSSTSLSNRASLPTAFTPLIQTISTTKRKAYQEGITELLLHDIIAKTAAR
ncbi:TIGR02679 family protein [Ktedonobacteria bacterium brp13]|nr:TIGR02679 family protein [Ktedonobacteria bacterium brp13]